MHLVTVLCWCVRRVPMLITRAHLIRAHAPTQLSVVPVQTMQLVMQTVTSVSIVCKHEEHTREGRLGLFVDL